MFLSLAFLGDAGGFPVLHLPLLGDEAGKAGRDSGGISRTSNRGISRSSGAVTTDSNTATRAGSHQGIGILRADSGVRALPVRGAALQRRVRWKSKRNVSFRTGSPPHSKNKLPRRHFYTQRRCPGDFRISSCRARMPDISWPVLPCVSSLERLYRHHSHSSIRPEKKIDGGS